MGGIRRVEVSEQSKVRGGHKCVWHPRRLPAGRHGLVVVPSLPDFPDAQFVPGYLEVPGGGRTGSGGSALLRIL